MKKYTEDQVQEANSRYFNKIEKKSIKLGLQYLGKRFRTIRQTAMKKNGNYQRLIGRKAWMTKTFSSVDEGGYLPFYKEEILPSEVGIKSAQELWSYIEITGDDGDFLIAKWRDEAEQTVKMPKILTMDHHVGDESKEVQNEALKDIHSTSRGLADKKRNKLRILGEGMKFND